MTAAKACQTGGACPISEHATRAILTMRSSDGRCPGCGRTIPKTSAPSSAPVVAVVAADGSEQTTDGAEQAPDAIVVLMLEGTSPEGLVDAVIQLTHKIHGCIDAKHDDRARDLRAQRALVKAEIVRRAS